MQFLSTDSRSTSTTDSESVFTPQAMDMGAVEKRVAARSSSNESAPRSLEEGIPLMIGDEESTGTPLANGVSSPSEDYTAAKTKPSSASVVSRMGLFVLILLAVQNCSKNLLMRFVMKDQPQFLTSAAVLGSECIKLSCSVLYILFIQKKPVQTIFQFLKDDRRNTLLLAVPGKYSTPSIHLHATHLLEMVLWCSRGCSSC